MTRTLRCLLALLVLLAAPPSRGDDGFTAIHQANQKIGSAVTKFWSGMRDDPAEADTNPFMAIYMANQKIGSPVANFWHVQAASDCPIDAAGK